MIETAEWIGLYYDMQIRLHMTARHYHDPGLHETGTTLDLGFNGKV